MNSLIRTRIGSLRPIHILSKGYVLSNVLRSFSSMKLRPIVAEYKVINKFRRFNSTTAPPPPPPPPPHDNAAPHDKNAKGKQLFASIKNAFTFSLSSLLVVGAGGVALLVIYLILSELFLPSGDTRTFNKAVKLVEKHGLSQAALESIHGERLKAYGQAHMGDTWVRNRPVHGIRSKGKDGRDHLLMQFHVEAASGKHGTVTLEQVDTSFWSSEFAYIALDVPGSKRIYVIEPKFQSKNYVPKLSSKEGFLGVKWGPKKGE